MPPKQKSSLADTPADQRVTIEARRLRARASPSLLQSNIPHHTTPIPLSLRKSDGADIVKRNANRKKKYLFVFPGALSLPASGGKIGSLASLDTRTPQLNIHFPNGTLRLLGTLVFPQNALLSVKPTRSAVQILDVFETLIVFSEWRWIGDPASNPAGLPVPLPNSIKAPSQQLWLNEATQEAPNDNSQIDEADIQLSSGSEAASDERSDDYLSSAAKIDHSAPVRSNPRRKGRVTNYSQLEESGSEYNTDEADGEGSDGAADEPQKGGRAGRPKKSDNDAQNDDTKTEDVSPGCGSRRKRRRTDYTESYDVADTNGHLDEDEAMDAPKSEVDERESEPQADARMLRFDDSVELVETKTPSNGDVKAPRARRNRRKIMFSQESDDEEVEDVEDDGDADFDLTLDDDGEGSDVVVLN